MPTGVYQRQYQGCLVEGCDGKHLAKGLCARHYHRKRNTGDTEFRPRYQDTAPEGYRTCVKCEEVKLLTDYRQAKRYENTYIARTCKQCEQETNKAWQRNNLEIRRRSDRRGKVRRAYGEKGLKLLDLIDSGEGECEVCRRKDTLHIDHDHATGETRGILCSNHNTALGLLQESPTRILKLLDYVQKYKD